MNRSCQTPNRTLLIGPWSTWIASSLQHDSGEQSMMLQRDVRRSGQLLENVCLRNLTVYGAVSWTVSNCPHERGQAHFLIITMNAASISQSLVGDLRASPIKPHSRRLRQTVRISVRPRVPCRRLCGANNRTNWENKWRTAQTGQTTSCSDATQFEIGREVYETCVPVVDCSASVLVSQLSDKRTKSYLTQWRNYTNIGCDSTAAAGL
jgi:hypothetical protein